MLNATSPLTPSDERSLAAAAQAGDRDAMAAIVQSQVRFMRSEARRYGAASGVPLDDLVSAATEALMEAVVSFDLERGTRLWTHAHHSISEAMADEVAAYGSSIPVPGRTLRRYRRAVRETVTLREAKDLAQGRDGMDPDTFDAVHAAVTGGESLSAPAGHEDDGEDRLERLDASTRLLGSRPASPESTAVDRAAIRQALVPLDARQRQVIALSFLNGDGMTDGEIARHLGVSRPTVTRTRQAALLIMRDALA